VGIVLSALPWFQSQVHFIAALGIIAGSGLLVLRRCCFRRSLVITEQAMLVPSGFLRLQPRSIALADHSGPVGDPHIRDRNSSSAFNGCNDRDSRHVSPGIDNASGFEEVPGAARETPRRKSLECMKYPAHSRGEVAPASAESGPVGCARCAEAAIDCRGYSLTRSRHATSESSPSARRILLQFDRARYRYTRRIAGHHE